MNYKTMFVNLLIVIALAGCSAPPAPTPDPLGEIPLSVRSTFIVADIAVATAHAGETHEAAYWDMTLAVGEARASAEAAAAHATETQLSVIGTANAKATSTATAATAAAVPLTQTAVSMAATQLHAGATATQVALANNVNDEATSRERWWWIWWSVVIGWICVVVFGVGYALSVAIEKSVPRLAVGWRAFAALPAPEDDDDTVDAEVTEQPSKTRIEKWREYIITFCEFGERPSAPEVQNTKPFSERRLDLIGVERELWNSTIGWLITAGVLVRFNSAKNSAAWWAGEWTLGSLKQRIMILKLPYPADHDPPTVDWSVLESAHAQQNTLAHA